MSISVRSKANSGGVKCIGAAMGHRRADKYLFANKQEYRCVSYRDLWLGSRTSETFESWLRAKGILAAA